MTSKPLALELRKSPKPSTVKPLTLFITNVIIAVTYQLVSLLCMPSYFSSSPGSISPFTSCPSSSFLRIPHPAWLIMNVFAESFRCGGRPRPPPSCHHRRRHQHWRQTLQHPPPILPAILHHQQHAEVLQIAMTVILTETVPLHQRARSALLSCLAA